VSAVNLVVPERPDAADQKLTPWRSTTTIQAAAAASRPRPQEREEQKDQANTNRLSVLLSSSAGTKSLKEFSMARNLGSWSLSGYLAATKPPRL